VSKAGTEENPLRVAIVGAGPSGFYAAEHILKDGDLHAQVDLFDRLPSPFGLVRGGVAPDHPKIKSVIRVYEKTAAREGFRFFGNVKVGHDVEVEDLERLYHAIVFTVGCETDRQLGIPGEDLPGSHAATAFVGWYNAHPDYAGEEFDLVCYVAEGRHRGKFHHITPDGDLRLIERPNEYKALSLTERTVILKLHGAVDRVVPERDSYVITEDHYIDYLTRTDIAQLVPVGLAARLRRSHFLFLGYSLADWNLRVILHRIWGEQELSYSSWSIQLDPKPLEEGFWRRRGVEILHARLEDYIDALAAHLGEAQRVEVAL